MRDFEKLWRRLRFITSSLLCPIYTTGKQLKQRDFELRFLKACRTTFLRDMPYSCADPALHLQWRVAINCMGPDKNMCKPTPNSKICASRFKPEDSKPPPHPPNCFSGRTRRRVLREGAVPSIFPFSENELCSFVDLHIFDRANVLQKDKKSVFDTGECKEGMCDEGQHDENVARRGQGKRDTRGTF